MNRIQSINPRRILWCCQDRGISPSDLASELGIAESSIEGVLSGEEGISFSQLQKVADFFGRGVLFFLEEDSVIEEQVHSPEFRTLANQQPKMSPKLRAFIEQAERQRAVYLSLAEDLDGEERRTFVPPRLPENRIPEAASVTRSWLALGDRNNFDSYRSAVEAAGVLVFRSNGYNGRWQISKDDPVLGFTLYDPHCPLIVVKKQAWETQQAFTLMHELGHLLLHKASSIDDEASMYSHKAREQQANKFAGYLLVPDAFLGSISDRERPEDVAEFDEWLEGQRRAWGISTEVILRRLVDAGRLPNSHYAAYREWRAKVSIEQREGGNRQYRHREPIHLFGNTFVRTVLDSLNARTITLARASSYLDGLKIKDLHSLEHYYAGL